MNNNAKISLVGFIAGGIFTLALILTTVFMTAMALRTCIPLSAASTVSGPDCGEEWAPGCPEVWQAVPAQSQPILQDLLVVQGNYTAPGDIKPYFSNEDIVKHFYVNKGKTVEAQDLHWGPAVGYFYNFRLVYFVYKNTPTLGIVADFAPNQYFIKSGLYYLVKKHYEIDSPSNVQLSVLDGGSWRAFGHIAFVSKGRATDDFRITKEELIKTIE